MRKILILLFVILLYGAHADVQAANSSLDSNNTTVFTQNKLQKKELENGNTIYTSKALNVNVILHPYISNTDKDYVDYVFFIEKHKIGNIRFYDSSGNFGDFGNVYSFINKNSTYIILEYLDESLERYYFIVDVTNSKISKIFEHKYGDKYSSLKYTPEKLLMQNKYLPITYTMYEKDGGLYLKVGSTYKSDIITLKKPNSGK